MVFPKELAGTIHEEKKNIIKNNMFTYKTIYKFSKMNLVRVK